MPTDTNIEPKKQAENVASNLEPKDPNNNQEAKETADAVGKTLKKQQEGQENRLEKTTQEAAQPLPPKPTIEDMSETPKPQPSVQPPKENSIPPETSTVQQSGQETAEPTIQKPLEQDVKVGTSQVPDNREAVPTQQPKIQEKQATVSPAESSEKKPVASEKPVVSGAPIQTDPKLMPQESAPKPEKPGEPPVEPQRRKKRNWFEKMFGLNKEENEPSEEIKTAVDKKLPENLEEAVEITPHDKQMKSPESNQQG